jgi:hypothetical protein
LCSLDALGVELPCDLAERAPVCVLGRDARDQLRLETGRATRPGRTPACRARLSPLGEVALELVDRNSRAPHSVRTVSITGTTRRSIVARLTPSASAACLRV